LNLNKPYSGNLPFPSRAIFTPFQTISHCVEVEKSAQSVPKIRWQPPLLLR